MGRSRKVRGADRPGDVYLKAMRTGKLPGTEAPLILPRFPGKEEGPPKRQEAPTLLERLTRFNGQAVPPQGPAPVPSLQTSPAAPAPPALVAPSLFAGSVRVQALPTNTSRQAIPSLVAPQPFTTLPQQASGIPVQAQETPLQYSPGHPLPPDSIVEKGRESQTGDLLGNYPGGVPPAPLCPLLGQPCLGPFCAWFECNTNKCSVVLISGQLGDTQNAVKSLWDLLHLSLQRP